jgi:hypothetical protein
VKAAATASSVPTSAAKMTAMSSLARSIQRVQAFRVRRLHPVFPFVAGEVTSTDGSVYGAFGEWPEKPGECRLGTGRYYGSRKVNRPLRLNIRLEPWPGF